MSRSHGRLAQLSPLLAASVLLLWATAGFAWQVSGQGARESADGAVELRGPSGVVWSADELGATERVRLTFSATHASGSAPLLVGPDAAGAWPAVDIPTDGRRHSVDLWIWRRQGLGIYLGSSANDAWRLEDLKVGRWPAVHIEEKWKAPEILPPLSPGWQPPGPLDARPIMLGREQALSVDVGSVRIIMPAEATCARGRRDEIKAQALNTATGKVELTIGLQGPPGVWLPKVTIPLKKHQQMVLRPEVTSLVAGQMWCRLVFNCGGQERMVPLKLTCLPAYPAFGFFVRPGAGVEALRRALRLPVSMVAAPCQAVKELAKPELGPEVLAYGTAVELTSLARAEAGGWVRIACVWGPANTWAEGLRALAADEAVKSRGWLLAAGPLGIATRDDGLAAADGEVEALGACRDLLSCVVAQPPALPVVPVARVRVDGGSARLMPFWQALWRRFDPAALRQQLRAAAVNVPVAWVAVDANQSRDHGEYVAAAECVWAPAVASLLYQGATAVLASWPQAFPAPWTELMRELSAGVPLVGPGQTDIADAAPGMPIVYKPFLRGREGQVVLSNTSADRVKVAVELAAEPLEANLLRTAPGVGSVRAHIMPFRFTETAFEIGRPIVLIELAPAETAVLSIRLVDPHPNWLKTVEKYKPPVAFGPQKDVLSRESWWWGLIERARKLREEEKRRGR